MSAKTPGVALSIAGIVAPAWFITLVIIQGVLQPDYSHIAMPVSALAAWPAGWIQRLNFYVLAALMAIFAIGVHRTKPHVVGAILSFSGASTGFIVLSRRLRADARWRSLAPYVLTTGLVMLILFVVLGAFAIEDGTPLHPWAALLQRVVVVVWFACTTTIAFRALRMERNAGRARAA